jgi:hypothetical protein
MTLLPFWLDTRDPEAVRGTARVRSVEPLWLAALDRRASARQGRPVYVVWGPQFTRGGWGPVCELGTVAGSPDWTGFVVAQQQARRGAERVVDRVLAHNERLIRDRERVQTDHRLAAAEYFGEAIAQEQDGTLRYGAQDVLRGWKQRWV